MAMVDPQALGSRWGKAEEPLRSGGSWREPQLIQEGEPSRGEGGASESIKLGSNPSFPFSQLCDLGQGS
jgi:hypothetical protein